MKAQANAVVIITLTGRQIWLAKRGPNSKHYPNTYGSPGGKVEYGEDLRLAATRELLEETGLKIDVERLQYLTKVVRNFEDSTVDVHWFSLQLKPEEIPQHMEPDVHEPWISYRENAIPTPLSPSTEYIYKQVIETLGR